jgi:hypothetical protein
MKILSLKLDDDIFLETEKMIKKMNYPRNRYINDALRLYNQHIGRGLLKNQLKKESILTRSESLKVLKEFEKIIMEIDAKI